MVPVQGRAGPRRPDLELRAGHVHGQLVVHDDPGWVREQVTRLTGQHEAPLARPWSVSDAPAPFIAGQLRAIVGVELRIARIEAKAKLSQNRSASDVKGVLTGMSAVGQQAAACAVEQAQDRA